MIPDLEIELSFTQNGFATGCYSYPSNKANIYLPKFDESTEEKLIEKFTETVTHESLHHCILNIIFTDRIMSVFDKHIISKNELIVRKMIDEPIDPLTYLTYRTADVTQLKKARKIMIILFVISVIFGLLVSGMIFLTLSLVRWLI
jgi:hypothetical protein